MNKLKQIIVNNENRERIAYMVGDRDFLKTHEAGQIFTLEKTKELKKRDDSLVDIEIALRKCKRLGVFSNK